VPGTRTARIALLLRPGLGLLQKSEGSARSAREDKFSIRAASFLSPVSHAALLLEPRRRGTSQYLSCNRLRGVSAKHGFLRGELEIDVIGVTESCDKGVLGRRSP